MNDCVGCSSSSSSSLLLLLLPGDKIFQEGFWLWGVALLWLLLEVQYTLKATLNRS